MYGVRETADGSGDGTGYGPDTGLFLSEPARGMIERAMLPLSMLWLDSAPRGDGHGVLVLPGFLAADTSTGILRRYLRRLRYDVRGWELGRNLGPTDRVVDKLPRVVRAFSEWSGGPISVVGWSLGGVYAREIGRAEPERVRQVITLGSPFVLSDPAQSRAAGIYRRRAHLHADPSRVPTAPQIAQPIPVPSTAVYSRRDGIVAWQACIEPVTELHDNVEVRCSHLGFGVDPATLWLIADRLALPAGRQPRFTPPDRRRHLYPGRT